MLHGSDFSVESERTPLTHGLLCALKRWSICERCSSLTLYDGRLHRWALGMTTNTWLRGRDSEDNPLYMRLKSKG